MASIELPGTSKLQWFAWLFLLIFGCIAMPIIDMLRESTPTNSIIAQIGLILGCGALGFAVLPLMSRWEKRLSNVLQILIWLLPLYIIAGATLYFQLQHGGEAILIYIVAPILIYTYKNTTSKLPTTRAEWGLIIAMGFFAALGTVLYVFSGQITNCITQRIMSWFFRI